MYSDRIFSLIFEYSSSVIAPSSRSFLYFASSSAFVTVAVVSGITEICFRSESPDTLLIYETIDSAVDLFVLYIVELFAVG